MSSDEKCILKFASYSLYVDIISKQRRSVMRQRMEAVVSFVSGEVDVHSCRNK